MQRGRIVKLNDETRHTGHGNVSAVAGRRKRLALVAAIMGSFVAGLDSTAVNVALPAIRADLGGGLAGQQWVSNAYLLTLGSLILVGGSLGDLYGERRVFSIGVGGFGVVSLLCAISPSIGFLIACRALQGAFGALLMPSSLAVIVARVPARGARRRDRLVDGLVGDRHRDRAARRRLPGRRGLVAADLRREHPVRDRHADARVDRGAAACAGDDARRVDWLGAVLTFFGLAGPVLALIRQPVVGWGSPQVWVPGLGGLAAARACSSTTSGARRRRCCRSACSSAATSRSGTCETFTMYGGLSVTFFLLVLFLQEVAGYSALDAGFALLPSTIVMFLLSKRMGRLADRYGPRLFMGLGPLTAAVGLALMTTLGAHVNYFTDLLPALLVFSLGLACTVAPLTAAVLSDAERGERRDRLGRQQRGRARRRPDRDRGDRRGHQRAVQIDARSAAWPGVKLSAAARTAVAQARSRDARPRRSGARRRAGRARRAVGVGRGVPPRDRDLGRARRARWPARAGRDSQPAARRCAARTAPAGRSPVSRSTPRTIGRRLVPRASGAARPGRARRQCQIRDAARRGSARSQVRRQATAWLSFSSGSARRRDDTLRSAAALACGPAASPAPPAPRRQGHTRRASSSPRARPGPSRR